MPPIFLNNNKNASLGNFKTHLLFDFMRSVRSTQAEGLKPSGTFHKHMPNHDKGITTNTNQSSLLFAKLENEKKKNK